MVIGNGKQREQEGDFEFEVLTAVTVKSTICCGVTPCSPVEFIDLSEEHSVSILTVKDRPTKNSLVVLLLVCGAYK
jgi:hypothetical protein